MVGWDLACRFPSVDGPAKRVKVVDLTEHNTNLADTSTVAVAATEVDCKTIRQATLIEKFGEHGQAAPDRCSLANQAALATARGLMAGSVSLERYDKMGKPFTVQSDKVCSTGITWQASGFGFSTTKDQVQVSSPMLSTGQYMLCKLLAPSRVVEYMMVDGLPRFDGSVP